MKNPRKSGDSSSTKSRRRSGLATVAPPVDPVAVNQVVEWIAAGHSEYFIRDAIHSTLSGHPLEAVINGAWERINSVANVPPGTVLAWSMEATRACYQKLFELGDFVGALRAAKQMADLADRLPAPPDDDEQDETD